MIISASKENKKQNDIQKLHLRTLIQKCNQDIISEKELLYNFKFSSESYESTNKIFEKQNLNLKNKVEENINITNYYDVQIKEKKGRQLSNLPNIFKERIKAFLNKKNLL